ncbi:MAG: S28 family serine protease [Ignavibacteriaceae bacterium]
MRQNCLKIIVQLSLIVLISSPTIAQSQLEQKLKSLEGIVKVTQLKSDSIYSEIYEVFIYQPVDHNNPEGDHFIQKIYIGHIDYKLPVVVQLAGYSLSYPRYNELADILTCNKIQVEHRYFGESAPKNAHWKYLTVEQAANDHHHIISLLKNIYHGKWISSGISKGGQTTMFHRYFFNDDVDASVPYVAPLNIAEEDPRIYHFLDNVGTKECRDKMIQFQREVLRREDELLEIFLDDTENSGYTYSIGSDRLIFEFIVLEYTFAFWQWQNNNCDEIPDISVSNEELFNHLKRNSPFKYFSDQGIAPILPFFYQAYSEIGYYGYDISPLKDLLREVKDPSSKIFIPPNSNPQFDCGLMQDINSWIQKHGNNMIFIYGGNDTWSAPAVQLTGETNSIKMVKEGGSHRTRINSFSDEEKEIIYSTLENWLDYKIER